MDTNTVKFVQADAYALADVSGIFNAGLANFWFSHVPKFRIHEFMQSFHHKLGSGALVFMADNTYLPNVGGELIKKSEETDTYKRRLLSDGSVHHILKNYYTAEELNEIFERYAYNLSIKVASRFWWLSYTVK